MQNYKHVGRIKTTGRRCLVVFRTLPGDAFNCLVIQTESLEPDYHDQLIKLVESPSAQLANEFSEVLARAIFSDGSTMLPSLHVKGLLSKVPTDMVEMMPNNQTSIILADLNQLIAQQQGVSVQDLAIKPNPAQNEEIQELAMVKEPPAPVQEEQVITATGTPEEQAKFYRSQADKLAKEAANFRRLAEELAPTKKKSTVNT
jgi:hypothetical protein